MLIECTKCGQLKDISCFAKDAQKKHGVRRECRHCMSLRTRKHWPEKLNIEDKRCAGCKKVHKKTEFDKDRTKKDGLYNICKLCRNKRNNCKYRRTPGKWHHDAYGYLIRTIRGEDQKQHRWIMERILKRKLDVEEHVHHINGVKDDNRPENLMIMSHGEHNTYHSKLLGERRKNGRVFSCTICGKSRYVNKGLALKFYPTFEAYEKIYTCKACYYKSKRWIIWDKKGKYS